MKAWTGAVIAILMMGLVFGLGLRSLPDASAARAAASAVPATATGTPAQAVPIVYSQVPVVAQETAALESVGGQAPVLVSCGAGQQTLVRQIWLNGQPTSQVECVGSAAARGVVYPSAQVRTVSNDEVVYDRVVVQEPRVVRAAQAPVYRQTERAAKPRRSWQKTALIIGGSTAAGAGVGGIVGGKKGALIGAAIGGGGSTIYEAIKRR